MAPNAIIELAIHLKTAQMSILNYAIKTRLTVHDWINKRYTVRSVMETWALLFKVFCKHTWSGQRMITGHLQSLGLGVPR